MNPPVRPVMIPRLFIASLICALGAGAWLYFSQHEKQPSQLVTEVSALRTERLELKATRFPVVLKTDGTVLPHQAMMLTAQVPGTVWRVSPDFETGAFFKKNDILLELDSSDLQAALTNAQSKLAKAEAAFAQEEAKAEQAKMNWKDLGYEDKPSPLVLRLPQLKEAQANVLAAKSDIGLAMRNLDRAKVRAPFDGRITSRNIQPGQSIAANTALAEIFATDYAEVRLPLSPEQAKFVKLPTRENDMPVEVTLYDAFGDREQDKVQTWRARIVRTEASVDQEKRQLFAIARVEDPCGLTSDRTELRLRQPVRADIHGLILDSVYVIPRKLADQANRVYRINKELMTLQPIVLDPVWSSDEELVIRHGVCSGDWIASSQLPRATSGTPVQVIERGEPKLVIASSRMDHQK